MSIKICTFNVKGLGDYKKRSQIFEYLKSNNYAICFLQELHCEGKTYNLWQKQWGNDAFFSGSSKNSMGVGILLNSNFTYKVVEYKNIIDGRLQSLKLVINDKEYTFLNVYGPNNDNVDFFNTLEKYVIDNNSDTFIIGGDFNTVIDVTKDKKNGNLNNGKKKRNKINTIINNNDIHDIWRILNPDTRHYTWHSNHKPPIYSRLDYFLVSSNILNSITKC